jgi:glycerol-3-phosphate dehydrogenase
MPPITKDEAEGTEYDLFVIGGGSGGLACAVSAADQLSACKQHLSEIVVPG